MKAIVFVSLALLALATARPEEKYTDRFDNVDLDEILSNKRLLEPYINCLLEAGKCSNDAKELRSHIKEALENNCGKCSDKQREGTRKVLKHIINNEPDYWQKLSAKYDPNNQFVKKYEKELKEVKEVKAH